MEDVEDVEQKHSTDISFNGPYWKKVSSSDSIIMVFCTAHMHNIAGFSQTVNQQNKIVRK